MSTTKPNVEAIRKEARNFSRYGVGSICFIMSAQEQAKNIEALCAYIEQLESTVGNLRRASQGTRY